MNARVPIVCLLLLALLGSSACMSRAVRRDVVQDDSLTVFLRSYEDWGSPVPQEYDQPVNIAPVRMAHILSRLDIRTKVKDGNQRMPAIPTEFLYPMADALSKALSEATPDEQAVAMAIRKTKNLYLFDRKHLTSLVAYTRGEHLIIHLSRTDWEIPPRRKDNLPEPQLGKFPMPFRIFPGEAMAQIDKQSVAIDWRDPVFRDPTRTQITAGGEVVRRTILMESPLSEWQRDGGESVNLGELSPKQLRELADLEESRRRGLIDAARYRSQRAEILGR